MQRLFRLGRWGRVSVDHSSRVARQLPLMFPAAYLNLPGPHRPHHAPIRIVHAFGPIQASISLSALHGPAYSIFPISAHQLRIWLYRLEVCMKIPAARPCTAKRLGRQGGLALLALSLGIRHVVMRSGLNCNGIKDLPRFNRSCTDRALGVQPTPVSAGVCLRSPSSCGRAPRVNRPGNGRCFCRALMQSAA